MRYSLNLKSSPEEKHDRPIAALRKFLKILADEKKSLGYSLFIILVHSSLTLVAPLLIGYTIDNYIQSRQYNGVIMFSGILLGMYIVTMVTSYFQTKLMGSVGQRVLFKLRNNIFKKLQELPVAFFNDNKAGDLISRINNDTDKLNQFFSQSLMQFVGSIFIMTGAGIFLLSINLPLGAAALTPAVALLLFSKLVTPWVKKLNAGYMASTGNLSAEIQESLANFRVVVAFNRRDYFRVRFNEVNEKNFTSAMKSGLANNIFVPVYGFFSNIGQMIVLTFGIYMIARGNFSVGLLISFLSYINNFYFPLRQLAALWTSFQIAMAGWDRISSILNLKSDIKIEQHNNEKCDDSAISFKNVSFGYSEGKEVLHRTNFNLEAGKTYAFVGPTGGGKTTTASLISRLYDPTKGTITLQGRDLKSFSHDERAGRIGFILQEPFLFTGTVKENIIYGNKDLEDITNDELSDLMRNAGLEELLNRFESGLETKLANGGETISLGQRQLLAFIRAVLRKPDILILDEATANIDTVTEQQLETILKKLPGHSTRIIIAHRLNTIENADEIFFINATSIVQAGSMDNAVQLLMQEKHDS
ncbi:MAG TPA: ABC transporter ATP-binding protein [Bacteroidales bacterium]|jgi:ATP-binding cassette subfamily B protein|nr:ABC transporter ATP-binding protein [Bacteroidales bacterium]